MIVYVRPEGGGRVRAVLLRSRIWLFVTDITLASCLQRRPLWFTTTETRTPPRRLKALATPLMVGGQASSGRKSVFQLTYSKTRSTKWSPVWCNFSPEILYSYKNKYTGESRFWYLGSSTLGTAL